MYRQEKRCPYCETPYELNGKYKHSYIASPFIRCSHCHKEFLDEECHEWLTLSPEERERYLAEWKMNLSPLKGILFGLFLMIVGVLFLLLTLLHFPFSWIYVLTGILLLFFGMGLFFPQIVNLDHIHNHVYSKEILSSLNRCKSPVYIKKLLSIKGTNLYKISQEDIDANHIQSLVDAIYLAIEIYKEDSQII